MNRPDPPTSLGSIPERLDRLPVTRLHLLGLALCGFAFAFDLLEIAIGNALAAVFTAAPHRADPGAIAWLLASVYIGAAMGAPVLGWLADRHGRRRVLTAALWLLAGTSLGAAFSDNVGRLSLWRGVAGVALGAYPPLMMAYLTDLLPPRRRGLLIFLTVGLASLGPTIGFFWLSRYGQQAPWGLEAWRWVLLAGAAGSVVSALLFPILPESARWLHARGRDAAAEQACARLERSVALWGPTGMSSPPAMASVPVASPHGLPRRQLMALYGIYFLSPWSTTAFPLLTGSVLLAKGFRLSDALYYVALSTFGPVLGTVLAALGVDRVERRVALGGCACAMVVCGLLFAASDQPAWLIASSLGFSLISLLYVPTLTVYGSEVFATRHRASMSALAWALNRVGAALAPLALLPLLHQAGPMAMVTAISATLLLSLVLLAFAPPRPPRTAVA